MRFGLSFSFPFPEKVSGERLYCHEAALRQHPIQPDCPAEWYAHLGNPRFGPKVTKSEHAWLWLFNTNARPSVRRVDEEKDDIFNNEVWIEMLYDEYLNGPLKKEDSHTFSRASYRTFKRVYKRWRTMPNIPFKVEKSIFLLQHGKIVDNYLYCRCNR